MPQERAAVYPSAIVIATGAIIHKFAIAVAKHGRFDAVGHFQNVLGGNGSGRSIETGFGFGIFSGAPHPVQRFSPRSNRVPQ